AGSRENSRHCSPLMTSTSSPRPPSHFMPALTALNRLCSAIWTTQALEGVAAFALSTLISSKPLMAPQGKRPYLATAIRKQLNKLQALSYRARSDTVCGVSGSRAGRRRSVHGGGLSSACWPRVLEEHQFSV